MNKTSIEWTDVSVNPLKVRRKDNGKVGWHCVKHSSGCAHCYSEAINKRFGTGLPYNKHSSDLVEYFLDDKALASILKTRTPYKVFPFDMTDLFEADVDAKDIATVFAVFAVANWHTFQTLTKRADRMEEVVGCKDFSALVGRMIDERVRPLIDGKIKGDWGLVSPVAGGLRRGTDGFWPLPNWWAGVSVENQAMANERLIYLRDTPAVVRWVSYEPAIGPLDIKRVYTKDGMNVGVDQWLSWLVAGGESGLEARPSHPDWFRKVRDDCVESGIAYFFKQWGTWEPVARPTDAEGVVGAGLGYPRGRWVELDGRDIHRTWDCVRVDRVGKKSAGRLLDGRTWNEFPETAHA